LSLFENEAGVHKLSSGLEVAKKPARMPMRNTGGAAKFGDESS